MPERSGDTPVAEPASRTAFARRSCTHAGDRSVAAPSGQGANYLGKAGGIWDALGAFTHNYVFMAHWEYKVITSGKGGFATPALMEKFLNDLGKDEWEILSFHTAPENPLAFHGLARRSTQREWTLEDAAAAAAKAEADKLRAEFAAKFSGAPQAGQTQEQPVGLATEESGKDDGLRRLRDTDRDHDPEALADEAAGLKEGDWDEWPEEDELPTFFEAVKPHLRRNQRGPGQSVAIDYLSKRWDQREADITGALVECGLSVPETDESPAEYFEFEGDLYWLNRNPRGQLFLNVREKPRPVFRTAQARRLPDDDPAAQELAAEAAAAKKPEPPPSRKERERAERAERESQKPEAAPKASEDTSATPAGPLPEGEALLEKLRPLMRRNRRGPGVSGTTGFLAKALKQSETDLVAALAAQGLVAPEKSGGKPEYVRIGAFEYWLNKDGRGGIWINGRERREGQAPSAAEGDTSAEAAPAGEEPLPGEIASEVPITPEGAATPEPAAGAPVDALASAASTETEAKAVESDDAPSGATEGDATESASSAIPEVEGADPGLVALRGLLKPNKRGSGASGELGFLQRSLEKSDDDFAALLAGAGLTIPASAEDKPTYVEHGPEIIWINRNPKDDSLWLNAKNKPARRGGGRSRKKAE
jgi:plasmid stabilization system protein ParE